MSRRSSRGMGAIAAILVLVVLATIAAGILRLSGAQSIDQTQDLQAMRAEQAALAGIDWGLYQALTSGGSWAACSGATHTTDLSSDLGMHVTISCTSTAYSEGETSGPPVAPQGIRIYTIDAVACNSAVCPDASRAVSPTYVERHRMTHATSIQ